MTGRSETRVPGKEFVITRTFDAPRELVWQAFAEGERMARWWGPKGCRITVTRFELRPGGLFLYSMGWPNGNVWWGRFIYREIAAPERLVFVNSFADEAGNIARAPFFDGKWPLEVLTTVTLAERDGKTMLTLHAGPINASEVEQETFASNLDSMRQGYGGTFDQLAAYLAQEQAGRQEGDRS